MNRPSSLSLQIAFFIIMILGLTLFFGAYALAVPAVAGYIWLAVVFGRRRLYGQELTLEDARTAKLNRFGLPNLPRFYGFLTVLWWLVPPILLLLIYRSFGVPMLEGMMERETLELMGKTIDYDQLHQFARSMLSTLGPMGNGPIGSLSAAQQDAYSGLQTYFEQQHASRRFFWLALIGAGVALWMIAPRQSQGTSARVLAFGLAMAMIVIALISGYGPAAILILLVMTVVLLSTALPTNFIRLLFMVAGLSLLVFLRDQTEWGKGGTILSLIALVVSVLVMVARGVRPRLDDARFVLIASAALIVLLLTVLTWLGAYGWLFEQGRILLFDISRGELGLQIQLLDNAAAALRTGEVADDPALAAAAERVLNAQNLFRNGYLITLASGVLLGVVGSVVFIRRGTMAQIRHEQAASVGMILTSAAAILVTVGIVIALLSNAELFFSKYPIEDFLFGLHWSKDAPIRDDQAGGFNLGAVPVFYGTMVVSLVALTVALPIGLMSAIYMAEYAGPRVRGVFKPILEILAGIPTIVYGVFALRSGIPFAKDFFSGLEWLLELRFLPAAFHLEYLALDVGAKSAVVAGAVMGIMLIPFISSLSDDALKAVPRSLRDGSLALGGNKSETILRVLIPAALPGIMGGFLLATSRAIGETMIVVLAAGGQANLTIDILDQMTTVTVQITELLIGDAEFDRANTLSVFGLGLVLFVSTLLLNLAAIQVVRRYRQRYS